MTALKSISDYFVKRENPYAHSLRIKSENGVETVQRIDAEHAAIPSNLAHHTTTSTTTTTTSTINNDELPLLFTPAFLFDPNRRVSYDDIVDDEEEVSECPAPVLSSSSSDKGVETRNKFDAQCAMEEQMYKRSEVEQSSRRIIIPAPRKRGRPRTDDDSPAERPSRSAPGGDDSSEAAESGAVPMLVFVRSFYWAQLKIKYGQIPDPTECFGCCYAPLGLATIAGIIYKSLIELMMDKLSNGVESTIMWAGPYFADRIVSFLASDESAKLTPDERRVWMLWTEGMAIIGHFRFHACFRQITQIFEAIELQKYYDYIIENQLCTVNLSAMNQPPQIQKMGLENMTRTKMLQMKVENIDVKKSCMYNQHIITKVSASLSDRQSALKNFSGKKTSERHQ